MSDDHEHHHHDPAHPPAPETQDAGSQALAEALRSSFAIVKIVMAFMIVAFFCSGFFQVGPSEQAIILRFGKPVGAGQNALLNSGLHWSFPYPIDEVVKIPVTENQKVTSDNGWYFTTPEQELSGEELPGPSLNPAIDGYVITGDRNIIHTRVTLFYHIEDPIRYVFGFTNAAATLRNILDEAVLYTAAHFKVDDALYNDQDGFLEAVRQRAADLADQSRLGVKIDNNGSIQNIPPRQLADVFSQITISRENSHKTVIDAQTYTNNILQKAGAQANTIVNEAESARTNYVSSVIADAKRFSDLLPRYESNPDLFVETTLLPVMGEALTNVGDIWLEPTAGGGTSIENRLMLNRVLPQPKPAAQNP